MVKRVVSLSLLVGLVLLVAAAIALGDRTESGNLVVTMSGDLQPKELPRRELAPVAVHLEARFTTSDQSLLPPLTQVAIRLGSQGRMAGPGLPRCRSKAIRATTEQGSLQACGSALVGRGHLGGLIALPGQRALPFRARFLVFHGGGSTLLGSVHSTNPPLSFTMPFKLSRGAGTFGTSLVADMPRVIRRWARVESFSISIYRRYRSKGHSRSYVQASCGVPKGFTGLVFPLAQTKFTFASGKKVTGSVVRACRVRGSGS